jgi:hypothetical protein
MMVTSVITKILLDFNKKYCILFYSSSRSEVFLRESMFRARSLLIACRSSLSFVLAPACVFPACSFHFCNARVARIFPACFLGCA